MPTHRQVSIPSFQQRQPKLTSFCQCNYNHFLLVKRHEILQATQRYYYARFLFLWQKTCFQSQSYCKSPLVIQNLSSLHRCKYFALQQALLQGANIHSLTPSCATTFLMLLLLLTSCWVSVFQVIITQYFYKNFLKLKRQQVAA